MKYQYPLIMQLPSIHTCLRILSAIGFTALLASCSGEGPAIIDPGADDRNETAFIAIDKGGEGDLARYYEVDGILSQSEYELANGKTLGLNIDAVYEQFENLYLHDNASGTIVVLDLVDRKEKGVISGFPSGDSARLCGMAFSNLSQGWVIAYGSPYLYHVDIRNLVLVRAIPLTGNPTAVATVGNSVFVGVEKEDGAGELLKLQSNDPDFIVSSVRDLPRPPFFAETSLDESFLYLLMPGESMDDPVTVDIDTDPLFFSYDLLNNDVIFQQRIFASPLMDYVGQHPNFASLSRDSFLYLATPEGVKRIDVQAFGSVLDILPNQPYSVVGVDYWSDLVYAVPTNQPNTVERITKSEERLTAFTLNSPITSIVFVRTSRTQ